MTSNLLQIVSVAQSVPAFKYNPKDSKKRNPNKRRRWLIPLFIVAQIALKVSTLAITQQLPLLLGIITQQMHAYICSSSCNMVICMPCVAKEAVT